MSSIFKGYRGKRHDIRYISTKSGRIEIHSDTITIVDFAYQDGIKLALRMIASQPAFCLAGFEKELLRLARIAAIATEHIRQEQEAKETAIDHLRDE